MKFKITHLEILVKESTKTMTECLNKLMEDYSKQSFHSQLDEAESPKMDCQDMVGYDLLHLEFSKVPIIDFNSTQRKYINFNQPLSKIIQSLQRKNLLHPR